MYMEYWWDTTTLCETFNVNGACCTLMDEGERCNNLGREGEKNGMYGSARFGDLNPMWGKKHSDEAKEKMRVMAKGRDHSHHSKPITLVNMGVVKSFNSLSEAARELGLSQSKLSLVLNGKRRMHKGWAKA